jgi:hypothetical protein
LIDSLRADAKDEVDKIADSKRNRRDSERDGQHLEETLLEREAFRNRDVKVEQKDDDNDGPDHDGEGNIGIRNQQIRQYQD